MQADFQPQKVSDKQSCKSNFYDRRLFHGKYSMPLDPTTQLNGKMQIYSLLTKTKLPFHEPSCVRKSSKITVDAGNRIIAQTLLAFVDNSTRAKEHEA